MKNSKLKIVLIIFAVIITLGIGAAYYAISQIDTNELRKIAKQEVEKKFPNSEVNIGAIGIGLGTSIEFKVASVKLRAKKNYSKDLLMVQDISVYIPIWSILTGGGTAEVVIKSPTINFVQRGESNNWSYTLKPSKKPKAGALAKPKPLVSESSKPSTSPAVTPTQAPQNQKSEDNVAKKEESSKALPALLAAIKLDFKLTNMNINYVLKDKSSGQVTLEKIIMKNLGAMSNAAFEISSQLNAKLTDKTFKSKLVIIGELNTSDLIKKKPIKSNILVKLNNSSLKPSDLTIPDLQSNIGVSIDPVTNKINADIDTKIGQKNYAKQKISVNGEKIKIDGIDVYFSLGELISYTGMMISQIDTGKSALTLKGRLGLNKGKIKPALEGKVAPELAISVDNIKARFGSNFRMNNTQFSMNSTLKIFDGVINTDISSIVNVNKIDPKKLPKVNINIQGQNLTLSKEFIQKTLYAPKKAKDEAPKADADKKASTSAKVIESPEKSKPNSGATAGQLKYTKKSTTPVKVIPAPILPNSDINLDFAKIKIGDTDFKLQGKIKVGTNTVRTNGFDFSLGKGKGSLQSVTTLKKNNLIHEKLNLKIKSLNLDAFSAFLPAQVKEITGTASGDINGEVIAQGASLKHDIDLKVSVLNGKLKSMDVGSYTKKLEKVKFLKGKLSNIQNIKGDFQKLILSGTFKHNDYHIKNMNFTGIKNQIVMKVKGHVYPLGKRNGELVGQLIIQDKSVSAALKKDVGTNAIPLKLVGKGFDLKPDYEYTLKKLAKSAAKAQGKKLLNKQKEKYKKKLEEKVKDDAKKKLEEKGKKLLKGLFR